MVVVTFGQWEWKRLSYQTDYFSGIHAAVSTIFTGLQNQKTGCLSQSSAALYLKFSIKDLLSAGCGNSAAMSVS